MDVVVLVPGERGSRRATTLLARQPIRPSSPRSWSRSRIVGDGLDEAVARPPFEIATSIAASNSATAIALSGVRDPMLLAEPHATTPLRVDLHRPSREAVRENRFHRVGADMAQALEDLVRDPSPSFHSLARPTAIVSSAIARITAAASRFARRAPALCVNTCDAGAVQRRSFLQAAVRKSPVSSA